eukprot:g3072.t1
MRHSRSPSPATFAISAEAREELQKAFSVADSNGNGFLDQEEIRSMLGSIQGFDAAPDAVDQLLGTLDANHDGQVSQSEFDAAIARWIGDGSEGVRKRKIDPEASSPVGLRRKVLHEEIASFFKQFTPAEVHLEDFCDRLEQDELDEDDPYAAATLTTFEAVVGEGGRAVAEDGSLSPRRPGASPRRKRATSVADLERSLTDNNWAALVEALHSGERDRCLAAMSHIAAVLSAIEDISSPTQRWRVAGLIIAVFHELVESRIPQLMCLALRDVGAEEHAAKYLASKILCLSLPGPSIPHTPLASKWSSESFLVKRACVEVGLVEILHTLLRNGVDAASGDAASGDAASGDAGIAAAAVADAADAARLAVDPSLQYVLRVVARLAERTEDAKDLLWHAGIMDDLVVVARAADREVRRLHRVAENVASTTHAEAGEPTSAASAASAASAGSPCTPSAEQDARDAANAMMCVLRSAAAAISTMCGHTHLSSNGESLLRTVARPQLEPALATVGQLLLHDDEQVLAASLFGLRHLLPLVLHIEPEVCDRLLHVCTVGGRFSPSSLPVQGALLCLRTIVATGGAAARAYLIEQTALVDTVRQYLDHQPSVDVRLHSLLLLEAIFAGGGDGLRHDLAVDVVASVAPRLVALLAVDDVVRSRAARLVRKLTKDRDAAAAFVQSGVVKPLFAALQQFRRHDNVLAHFYGHHGPTFNFALVRHALQSLSNILAAGASSAEYEGKTHPFLDDFNMDGVHQLQGLVVTLLEEVASDKLSSWRNFEAGSRRLEAEISSLAETMKGCHEERLAQLSQAGVAAGAAGAAAGARGAVRAAETSEAVARALGDTLEKAALQLRQAVALGEATESAVLRVLFEPTWAGGHPKSVKLPLGASLEDTQRLAVTWTGRPFVTLNRQRGMAAAMAGGGVGPPFEPIASTAVLHELLQSAHRESGNGVARIIVHDPSVPHSTAHHPFAGGGGDGTHYGGADDDDDDEEEELEEEDYDSPAAANAWQFPQPGGGGAAAGGAGGFQFNAGLNQGGGGAGAGFKFNSSSSSSSSSSASEPLRTVFQGSAANAAGGDIPKPGAPRHADGLRAPPPVLSRSAAFSAVDPGATGGLRPRSKPLAGGADGGAVAPHAQRLEVCAANLRNKFGIDLSALDVSSIVKLFQAGTSQEELGPKEFYNLMIRLGVKDKVALQQAWAAFDLNKNGKVHLKEWLISMAIMKRGNLTQRLKLVFQAFDRDGSKTLDRRELASLIKHTHQCSKESAVATAEQVIEKCDVNHDGALDFREFAQACVKNQKLLNTFWTRQLVPS